MRDATVASVPFQRRRSGLLPDEDATSSTTARSHSTAWSVATEMLELAFAFRRRAFFKVISESQRWPLRAGFSGNSEGPDRSRAPRTQIRKPLYTKKEERKRLFYGDRKESETRLGALRLSDCALIRSLIWELAGSALLGHSIITVVEESGNAQSVQHSFITS